jgi:transposase-like protein|tara:strand:- start:44 stop:505 length:462 start_codon:yes stop_codon:yes gene_type:complete
MRKDKMYHTTMAALPQTEGGTGGLGAGVTMAPEPEVAAKAKRRRFSAEYKLRILEEIDRAAPGQRGAILRREGLYSSSISAWRQARRKGSLSTLSARRGPKAKPLVIESRRIAKLERELTRTKEELRKAHLILDVQGKVAELLGFSLEDGRDC